VIVLDTSVLSVAFRRRGPAHAPDHAATHELRLLMPSDRDLAIPGIVYQEVLSFVRNPPEVRRLQDALSGFRLLLADRSTHVRAATLTAQADTAGVAVGTADALVAAHAMVRGAVLFTIDDDFERLSRVAPLQLHRF